MDGGITRNDSGESEHVDLVLSQGATKNGLKADFLYRNISNAGNRMTMIPKPTKCSGPRKAWTMRFLITPEQLPAIPGDGDLAWDANYSEGKDRPRTVLIKGDHVLFAEPASWKAIQDCYEQIWRMGKERYGSRVRDLVPTAASEMWFYGDKMSGPILRASIRDEVV